MLIGYARVSKADGAQIPDLQIDALLEVGVDKKHIYTDHASGTKDDRPGLEACLKALRPGDTLIVWKLDRLGRNLKHLVTTTYMLWWLQSNPSAISLSIIWTSNNSLFK